MARGNGFERVGSATGNALEPFFVFFVSENWSCFWWTSGLIEDSGLLEV